MMPRLARILDAKTAGVLALTLHVYQQYDAAALAHRSI